MLSKLQIYFFFIYLDSYPILSTLTLNLNSYQPCKTYVVHVHIALRKNPILDLTLRSRAGPSLRFPHSHYLRTTQYITRLTINVKTTHSSCVWLTHISDIHFYHSKLWYHFPGVALILGQYDPSYPGGYWLDGSPPKVFIGFTMVSHIPILHLSWFIKINDVARPMVGSKSKSTKGERSTKLFMFR